MIEKKKKYSHLFDSEHINRSVKKKSLKAGMVNVISQGLSLFITLGRAAILARLLSPDDYGVFTIAIVVISFALIFKDLGLSTATICEKTISHEQVSNLFWINTGIGLLSMLVVIVISPALVWLYTDSRLLLISLVLSIAFFFAGMTVQHQALLKRQMKFGNIALISVFSDILSSLMGIVMAWFGYEYWALIWMNVSRNIFLMIGFWLSTRWVPGLPVKGVGTKKMLKVGFDVAGLNAFSTLTQSIDKLIAGRIASTGMLGLYTKGNQVPNLLSGQFRMAFFSVALPALSSLQDEKERFAQYYYDFLNLISWMTLPFAVAFFVFADDIILIYFGPQWAGSIPFMKIFAIHALLMPIITTLDQIPLALGYSRRYLGAGIVRSLGTIVCVAIGSYFNGIVGIAVGVAMANAISFLPFALLCLKKSPVTFNQFFKTISFPIFTSIFLGSLFTGIKYSMPNIGPIYGLLLMICYFMGVIALMLGFDFFRIGRRTGVVDFIRFRQKGDKQTA